MYVYIYTYKFYDECDAQFSVQEYYTYNSDMYMNIHMYMYTYI